ncbi:MAG: PEGA domain-containing protein [Nitrosomonadales bacterium]|nr:PEGA domain-containing protein [Nitrosomonadales bacterium]
MMKRMLLRGSLALAVLLVAGCSMPKAPSGWFGSGDGAINLAESESRKANPNAPLLKYAASIRVARYADARKTANPRQIGTADRVSGMSGKDITLSQDVAAVVAGTMKTRLDDAGFQVSDAQNSNALFELTGVVKELTLNVKDRDEISIVVETSLKELSTGAVVWSGVVVEKNDRFAGVSGNNKNDVANYLRKELGIVAEKTVEALSASLMAARPELFNLTPGTKPIPGVTVLVAPPAGALAPVAAPQPSPAGAAQLAPLPAAKAAAPSPAYPPLAGTSSGMLIVSTIPGRAKVYVDNVYYGLSPLHMEIDAGIHAVSVKLEGYKMVTEKVSVRKGAHTEMDLTLER